MHKIYVHIYVYVDAFSRKLDYPKCETQKAAGENVFLCDQKSKKQTFQSQSPCLQPCPSALPVDHLNLRVHHPALPFPPVQTMKNNIMMRTKHGEITFYDPKR